MANDDKTIAVARVYAGALLALAEDRGVASDVGGELAELAALAGRDASFAAFVASPTLDTAERRSSLERIFRGRASDLVTNTLQVMNAKGRLALLPVVAGVYRQLHDERHGRVEVEVKSAVPLSEEQRRSLAVALESFTGRQPVLREEVDATLLGGLVVRVGDRKVDSSIRRELHELRLALDERAAREVLRGRLADAVVGDRDDTSETSERL